MAQMPYDGDLLTVLAVALREVDTIEVGSAVLPIQNQHPMQLAQRALMLNADRGRPVHSRPRHEASASSPRQMWGISYDKPLRRMREYLDGLQPLLAGQAADAVGETVTTRGALQVPGAPAPDVYHRRVGSADAAVGGAAHGGNAHVDVRPQDAVGTHRPDAARGGRGSRTPGDLGAGRRPACRSA